MIESRFYYFASAAGASARVTRIEDDDSVDHIAPVQAVSMLTSTGGLSKAEVGKFSHPAPTPRPFNIMSFESARTKAWSDLPTADGTHVSNVSAEVKGLSFLDRVHTDLIQANLKTVHRRDDSIATITPYDCVIEGLRLDDYRVIVEIDLDVFQKTGCKTKLQQFYAGDAAFRKEHCWRFNDDQPDRGVLPDFRGHHVGSVVKSIRWADKAPPDAEISGYTIRWEPFGKIILGEIILSGHHHRLTMIRAKMGSPVGGEGTGGDITSNGTTLP